MNQNENISNIYPEQAQALEVAKLHQGEYPTLKKLIDDLKIRELEKEKEEKEKKKKDKNDESKEEEEKEKKPDQSPQRQTYFCVGFSNTWKGPKAIHVTLKKF